MWWLLAAFGVGAASGGVAWWRGYRQGKRAGDAEHAACHLAMLGTLAEAAHMREWEEEL